MVEPVGYDWMDDGTVTTMPQALGLMTENYETGDAKTSE